MAAQADPAPDSPAYEFVLVYLDDDGIYRLGLADEVALQATIDLEEPLMSVYCLLGGQLLACRGANRRESSADQPAVTWDLYAGGARVATLCAPADNFFVRFEKPGLEVVR